MKTECDYLNGWIKKRSHTQKSHPKAVNPRDIAGERKRKKRKRFAVGLGSTHHYTLPANCLSFASDAWQDLKLSLYQFYLCWYVWPKVLRHPLAWSQILSQGVVCCLYNCFMCFIHRCHSDVEGSNIQINRFFLKKERNKVLTSCKKKVGGLCKGRWKYLN